MSVSLYTSAMCSFVPPGPKVSPGTRQRWHGNLGLPDALRAPEHAEISARSHLLVHVLLPAWCDTAEHVLT